MQHRNLKQDYTKVPILNWHGHGKFMTALMNGMSCLFPVGERFFIASIRKQETLLPEWLKNQVDIFVKQEGAHSREHQNFNNELKRLGLNIDKINEECLERLNRYCEDDADRLFVTVVLEHVTGLLGYILIKFPELIPETSDPVARELWMWHALEEIEHAHVSTSVFNRVTKVKPKYLLLYPKIIAMLVLQTTINYRRISKLQKQYGV